MCEKRYNFAAAKGEGDAPKTAPKLKNQQTMEISVTNFENCIKQLRASELLRQAAAGCNPAGTDKQYYLLSSAANFRDLANKCWELYLSAQKRAQEVDEEAEKAEAERKALKRV